MPHILAMAGLSVMIPCGFIFNSYRNASSMLSIDENHESRHNQQRDAVIFSRNFVADAVECVSPAVVNIVCVNEGLFTGSASAGSGFIISNDGFIVTNAHVIANAKDRVIITFSNGRRKAAKIHSMDAKSDLALLKIEDLTEELPTVALGSSSKIRAGEKRLLFSPPQQ